ncbi:unnamed protein product, partial [Aphanomyces euteiches]
MKRDGVPVTYEMLRIMAMEMASEAGIRPHKFKASTRWTRIGQASNEDGANALEEFSTKIRTIIEEERIALVLNADQTAINYEYLPTKTLNSCGEKTVWVKCGGKTKERATAMVLGDAS